MGNRRNVFLKYFGDQPGLIGFLCIVSEESEDAAVFPSLKPPFFNKSISKEVYIYSLHRVVFVIFAESSN